MCAEAARPAEHRELGRDILRSVSRSFYLSLRVLPKPLREPVSLAYLLARATDTIADTVHVGASVRAGHLRVLAEIIQGEQRAEAVETLRSAFAPLQSNDAERRLIEALPSCIDWLQQLDAVDCADVREVLRNINRGQTLDVVRFGDAGTLGALASEAELDEYTYLVAGCVGEFWTRLGFRHIRGFADLPTDQMLDLGIRYGKGLQLINILRDAGSDLRAGRCYLPADELASCGMSAAQLLNEPERARPVFRKWQERAAAGIAAGVEYGCAITNRRVRFATALPALIGARTLARLRAAGAQALHERVKIPRAQVRRLMLTAFRSRKVIRAEANRALR
jgi:farnesyl-diphosphate farnesyltransferase